MEEVHRGIEEWSQGGLCYVGRGVWGVGRGLWRGLWRLAWGVLVRQRGKGRQILVV